MHTPEEIAKTKRFLLDDKSVLMFKAIWEDRDSPHGDLRCASHSGAEHGDLGSANLIIGRVEMLFAFLYVQPPCCFLRHMCHIWRFCIRFLILWLVLWCSWILRHLCCRTFEVRFFLCDDTIEVIERVKPNCGRNAGRAFAFRYFASLAKSGCLDLCIAQQMD